MPLFRQTETLKCYVTWIKELDAESWEEATTKFDNGEGEVVAESIGDSIDGYEECHVAEVEPTGALMPDGTKLNQWDERLRTSGGVPTYD